jgi:cytochrome d ubiquinol oxidase subunit II
LLLVGLILRGVAFEFRSKDDNPRWRSLWDWCIFAGSLLPALLLGVAFANLVRGVPIDGSMQYTGGFFNLLNPYALLGGLATIAVFMLHGAIFLSMKTTDSLLEKAKRATRQLWIPAVALVLAFVVATFFATDLLDQKGFLAGLVPVLGAAALLASGYFVRRNQYGWSFIMTCLTIALTLITHFVTLFPRVMISSTNPNWSLTIYNASSSDYTLRTMTIVAVIFVPIVLAYQAWSYWVFRKRVQAKPEQLTY